MTLLDHLLRRADDAPSMAHINEAAAIVERGIGPGGMLRPELLVDAIAAALAERDAAAASLDASNQAIIATLRDAAGVPPGAVVIPMALSKAVRS